MRKLPLADWAALAEVIGTIGVLISLVFVIQSINLNTKAIQANNDNFVYELQDSHIGDVVNNPGFADITKKVFDGRELGELEAFRWTMHLNRFRNFWEMMYTRHEDGVMPEDAWETWDRSAIGTFNSLVSASNWEENRPFTHPGFREHVDSIISDRD